MKSFDPPLGLNRALKGSRRVTRVDFAIIAKSSPKIWFSCNKKNYLIRPNKNNTKENKNK